MRFIKDILPIFKKYEIQLKKSSNAINDIYTFVFQADQRINWKAGQHGVFTIRYEKIRRPTRVFSIASTSNDEFIEISTRIGEKPSEFKQALLNLKPGMKISMRGPIGGFYIKSNKPTLLIAGGLGITPFKSIVKNSIKQSNEGPEKLHLIYLDSKEEFLYKDDFNHAHKQHFSVEYISEREDLTKSMDKFIQNHKNDGSYFIAGSANMTKLVSELLRNRGINKKSIIKDTFIGY